MLFHLIQKNSDIDSSSINKIVQVDLPIIGDKVILQEIYNELKKRNLKLFL